MTANPIQITQYTPVWHKGTGLPTSLPPGEHHISQRFVRDGTEYVEINHAYYTTQAHVVAGSG